MFAHVGERVSCCFVNGRAEFYACVSIEVASNSSNNWKSFIEFDRRVAVWRFWAKDIHKSMCECVCACVCKNFRYLNGNGRMDMRRAA